MMLSKEVSLLANSCGSAGGQRRAAAPGAARRWHGRTKGRSAWRRPAPKRATGVPPVKGHGQDGQGTPLRGSASRPCRRVDISTVARTPAFGVRGSSHAKTTNRNDGRGVSAALNSLKLHGKHRGPQKRRSVVMGLRPAKTHEKSPHPHDQQNVGAPHLVPRPPSPQGKKEGHSLPSPVGRRWRPCAAG